MPLSTWLLSFKMIASQFNFFLDWLPLCPFLIEYFVHQPLCFSVLFFTGGRPFLVLSCCLLPIFLSILLPFLSCLLLLPLQVGFLQVGSKQPSVLRLFSSIGCKLVWRENQKQKLSCIMSWKFLTLLEVFDGQWLWSPYSIFWRRIPKPL